MTQIEQIKAEIERLMDLFPKSHGEVLPIDQNAYNLIGDLKKFIESLPSELVNFDEAEKEKDKFVSGNYIECRASFNGFKEDNSYWFEYVGDDNYIGRSDNILNQKFHITPRQLYTLFTQQHCPKGECGVSLQKKLLISRIYNWFKCLINSNIVKK